MKRKEIAERLRRLRDEASQSAAEFDSMGGAYSVRPVGYYRGKAEAYDHVLYLLQKEGSK